LPHARLNVRFVHRCVTSRTGPIELGCTSLLMTPGLKAVGAFKPAGQTSAGI
jgi:hypothetical protein